MTEDKTVGWHHQCDGHEFESALGVGDGQGGLVGFPELCGWISFFSCVCLLVTPWTVAHRLICSWDFQTKILEWVAISSSRGSS